MTGTPTPTAPPRSGRRRKPLFTGNEYLLRRVFYIQLVTVGIGYLIYAMNRSAFPVGLSSIGNSLGFTAFQVGTLATVFLLGQAIIDVPAGVWNKASRRGVTNRTAVLMFIGTAGAGLASIAFALFAINFPTTVLFRVLFGIAEGLFNVCVYAFAGSVLPARRAFMTTLLGFFFSAGSMIGPVAFSNIISHSASDEGWKTGLLVFGVITVVFGVIMLVVQLTSIRHNLRKTLGSLDTAPGQSEAAVDDLTGEDEPDESFVESLRAIVRRKAMWAGLSIHAVNLIAYWEFSGLLPSIMIDHQNKSVAFVGFLFGTGFGLTSMLSPVLGWIADLFGRRVVVASCSLVNVVCLIVLITVDVHPVITFLLTFLAGVGLNTLYFFGYALAQDGVPLRRVAVATGLAGAIGYLVASAVGPVAGLITQAVGYEISALTLLVVPQIVVALLAMRFLPSIAEWRAKRRSEQEVLG